MHKPILLLFGGISSEHEVSVITGLQVLEHVDLASYEPHVIYVDKTGRPFHLRKFTNRKQFLSARRDEIAFGKDKKGGFVKLGGWGGTKIYPYAAYLAFHGGSGEGGVLQGFLEALEIPFTSPDQEAAAIAMNKELTKLAMRSADIQVLPSLSFYANDVRKHVEEFCRKAVKELGLPLVVKPVHLGSSIGIRIASTDVELEKFILEAAFIDKEILVEPCLVSFVEYNCSVRRINGKLEASEIEKPISRDEILSFADKYERGGKKSGAGMASSARELPAKIGQELKLLIQDTAKQAFVACRAKGMIRIDFMHANGKLYLTEINPIPGSMAFYLWEASGIPFKQQITDLIEQAVIDAQSSASFRLEYKSNIIEQFLSSD